MSAHAERHPTGQRPLSDTPLCTAKVPQPVHTCQGIAGTRSSLRIRCDALHVRTINGASGSANVTHSGIEIGACRRTGSSVPRACTPETAAVSRRLRSVSTCTLCAHPMPDHRGPDIDVGLGVDHPPASPTAFAREVRYTTSGENALTPPGLSRADRAAPANLLSVRSPSPASRLLRASQLPAASRASV